MWITFGFSEHQGKFEKMTRRTKLLEKRNCSRRNSMLVDGVTYLLSNLVSRIVGVLKACDMGIDKPNTGVTRLRLLALAGPVKAVQKEVECPRLDHRPKTATAALPLEEDCRILPIIAERGVASNKCRHSGVLR